MKLFTKLFILSAAVTALSGCRSDLLDTVPYDKAASNSMWTNENFCELGVTGVYHELREDYIAKKAYELEAYCVSGSCRDNDYSILAGTASTGSGLFSDYWKQHYEGIQRANDAISHLAEAPVPDAFKNKLIAEVKILRAFFYYKLNAVFRGVPYYDVPVLITEANKPRSSEIEIWEACVKDLTDAINEPTLPDRIAAGNAQWGRVTKSVAYALRGKVYLWMQDWAKAEADFRQVGNMGHKLFDGGYKQLFKEANEQSDEAIFSLQCIDNNETADGNSMSFRYGGRTTFGSCWNTILASTDFVDTYENIDGSKFNWDDYLPGYSSMEPKDREVFFLRNTDADVLKAELLSLGYEGDIDAAIKGIREKVENRLSKLSEMTNREKSPIDLPIIRYATVVLGLAEALNEQGKTAEAIEQVNLVRERAGVALLNSNAATQVSGQDDMRTRIQNEYRWETAGEGVSFYEEMRWKTWKESKFNNADGTAGMKDIWGVITYNWTWGGDQYYVWPIPKHETDMNTSLTQNPGW